MKQNYDNFIDTKRKESMRMQKEEEEEAKE